MMDYHWPGNVRELENVIERFVALSDGSVIDGTLIREVWKDRKGFSSLDSVPIHEEGNLRDTVAQYEKKLIEAALKETSGNKNRAAKKLGLTRQALQYKLDKYGVR